MRIQTALVLALALTFGACGDDEEPQTDQPTDAGDSGDGDSGDGDSGDGDSGDGDGAAELAFTGAFTEGTTIPSRHKCPKSVLGDGMGDNVSPALSWSGAPDATKSFALVLFDTKYNVFHWAIWDIPGDVTELPEGIDAGYEVSDPAGAHQGGAAGSDKHAYFGPCSDAGPQAGTYAYRLYALDAESLSLSESSTGKEIQAAVDGATLAMTEWVGTPE